MPLVSLKFIGLVIRMPKVKEYLSDLKISFKKDKILNALLNLSDALNKENSAKYLISIYMNRISLAELIICNGTPNSPSI